jgi:chromosome segregation ATPase
MKKILCFVSCLAVLTSCDYFTREKEQLTAQNDSLTVALSEKQFALDQAMQSIADIQEGFRAINEAEGRVAIQTGVEGVTDAQRLKEDLQFIQQKMEENRKQIEQLQKKLNASGSEAASLRKVLANLQQELADKTASIAALHSELAQKNFRIAELDSAVVMLTTDVNTLQEITDAQHEVIEQQVTQLHTAWYVYGTAKELKEQNILKDGKVMSSADFNKNYFTEIDTRDDSVFPLYAKHAKLLTVHPVGSYEFTKDESKQLTLSIIDAEAFWSVSRYMVILVR